MAVFKFMVYQRRAGSRRQELDAWSDARAGNPPSRWEDVTDQRLKSPLLYHGPVCQGIIGDNYTCVLTSFNGKIIGIDVVGAVIPIVISLLLLLTFAIYSRPIDWIRTAIWGLFTTVLGVITALEFMEWDYIYGGLLINTTVIFYTFVPIGIAAYLVLDRGSGHKTVFRAAIPIYIMGVFGNTLADVIRISSNSTSNPIQIIGGAGIRDGIFSGWVMVLLGYYVGVLLYTVVLRYVRERTTG
jgi:hypothetical protein